MAQENHYDCPICGQAFTSADGMTADEHLARGILKAYADMQSKRKNNSSLPCPRCGEHSMSTNTLRNALSRQFDIHICDACGNREAIEAAKDIPTSIQSWWVVVEILKRK